MTVDAVVAYFGTVLAGCAAVSIADSFSASEMASRLRIAKTAAIVTQVAPILHCLGVRKYHAVKWSCRSAAQLCELTPACAAWALDANCFARLLATTCRGRCGIGPVLLCHLMRSLLAGRDRAGQQGACAVCADCAGEGSEGHCDSCPAC